jgi:hypothetical protein
VPVKGRMLDKGISTSPIINGLSARAVILFTWATMYEDSEGFLEAEKHWLKYNIVPMRKDIPEEDIPALAIEIIQAGAWVPFVSDNLRRIVWDPKFRDHQKLLRHKNNPKFPEGCHVQEAPSKFFDYVARKKCNVTQVPMVDVEKIWMMPQVTPSSFLIQPAKKIEEIVPDTSSSPSPHLGLSETNLQYKEKKGNVIKEREDGEARPLSLKNKTVKELLDEVPELYTLVKKLREGKWPEVGGWLGMAMSEVELLRVENLIKTLEIIDAKEEFTGNIFPFALTVLKNVVNEGVTRRVEEKAQEMKKDEGFEKIGEVLSRIGGEKP